jgi:hypothetical protein
MFQHASQDRIRLNTLQVLRSPVSVVQGGAQISIIQIIEIIPQGCGPT